MDEDERGRLLKFDPAAKRKGKLNGATPAKGLNKDFLLKILGTAVAAATVALGYYALYGIN